MRCLYEVLSVNMDADDGIIKAAYRRAALQWHPDKNQDRPDEAAERFKEIQNAYEVLSDRHERAWYDSHRAAILRSGTSYQAGAEGFAAGEAPDSEVDLFPYFSSSCFSGYGEGPKSFYGVYGELFARLAANERIAGARADMPALGGPSSAWAGVAAFYAHWTAFSTVKDFSWADQYNPASAPNRKVRRLMEDDNRKNRAQAKRTFNETVRELAAFVRKRDKRVATHQAEQAMLKAQQEEAMKERREAERKEREARARAYREAEWVTAAADGESSESDGEPEIELLHCVVCDKLFRSAGALANHERSKKHLEAVAVLRAMLEQDEALESDNDDDDDGESQAEAEKDASAGTAAASSHAGGLKSADGEVDDASDGDGSRTSMSSADDNTTSPPDTPTSSSSSPASSVVDDMDDDEFVSRLARGTSKAAFGLGPASDTSSTPTASPDVSDAEGDQVAGPSDAPGDGEGDADVGAVAAGLSDVLLQGDEPTTAAPNALAPAGPSDTSGGLQEGKRKNKTKAQRARAKAAATPAAPELACRQCRQEFQSRTQLFKHLAQTGHH